MEPWSTGVTLIILAIAFVSLFTPFRRSPKVRYAYAFLYMFAPYILITVAFVNLYLFGLVRGFLFLALAVTILLVFVRRKAPTAGE